MALYLLSLPHEVLHCILTHVNPDDIARLSCCKSLHTFIKSDTLLFKELYLKHYDDPQYDVETGELNWEESLHNVIRLDRILESGDASLKKQQIEVIHESIDYLLRTSKRAAASPTSQSRNIALLSRHFGRDHQKGHLLTGSSLYKWAASDAWQQPVSTCTSFRERGLPLVPATQEMDTEAASQQSTDDLEHEQTDHALHTTTLPFLFPRRQRNIQAPYMYNHSPPLGLMALYPHSDQHLRMRQISAKLHCLYGVPIQEVRRDSTSSQRYSLRSDSAPVHHCARSRAYDLRQHTEATHWGPFFNDNSQEVDWEKVEAIMLILDHNMSQYAETHEITTPLAIADWSTPFAGTAPYSYVPLHTSIPSEPPLPLEAQDPYNITGTWMRVVCFLDYTELFDFNFTSGDPPPNQPRPPLDTDEAIRLITMRLVVSKIEQPGRESGQRLPVVWFKGESSSARPTWDPNATSKIRGCVRLTPRGEVRWTSWSIFYGEERWKSEGIQVGGIQSARGVLGYWFDKDFDEHGPAGPTAFWKAHDGIEAPPKPNVVDAQAQDSDPSNVPPD